MDALIFENLVTINKDQFIAKVRSIASKLFIDPNWLMAVMYKESGLNHRAVNSHGGATGLIQFMPATATGLGTTTQSLLAMSNVDQLDYVYKYFQPYKLKILSYPDLYLITFFPAALSKPIDYIFQTTKLPAAVVARFNPTIDINKDGTITMSEFITYSYNGFTTAVQTILKKKA